MQRGTREIEGRFYLLFNAMDWFGYGGIDEDEHVQSEVAAARRRYESVRVFRDRRRHRLFIYVFGER